MGDLTICYPVNTVEAEPFCNRIGGQLNMIVSHGSCYDLNCVADFKTDLNIITCDLYPNANTLKAYDGLYAGDESDELIEKFNDQDISLFDTLITNTGDNWRCKSKEIDQFLVMKFTFVHILIQPQIKVYNLPLNTTEFEVCKIMNILCPYVRYLGCKNSTPLYNTLEFVVGKIGLGKVMLTRRNDFTVKHLDWQCYEVIHEILGLNHFKVSIYYRKFVPTDQALENILNQRIKDDKVIHDHNNQT